MIGRTVGNYRLVKRLGEGGMGVVYLAEHPGIGRKAAVKFLHADLAKNKRLLKRFFNEARAAASIRHPGVVEVYDFGTTPEGDCYITMELVEGETLAARLARGGRLPPAVAIELGIQIACALGAVHEKRIVHRDLKPDNLSLTPDPRRPGHDLVKVLDFGIARLDGLEHGSKELLKTQTGSVLGTPVYMSPEQCRGKRAIDHRSDVYSLGVVLYEMVCGAPPFVSEGFGELVFLQIGTPPPRPRLRNPEITAELEMVILTMLAKDPARRLQSMATVVTALTAAAGVPPAPLGTPAPLTAMGPLRTPTRTTLSSTAGTLESHQPRRSRRLIAAGVLTAALGGGAWLALPHLPAARQAQAPRAPAIAPARAPVTIEERTLPRPAPKPHFDPAESVAIAITTTPPGATVLDEAGELVDFTPYAGQRPRGKGTVRLRLEKEGFRAVDVLVPLDRGVTRHVVLRRK